MPVSQEGTCDRSYHTGQLVVTTHNHTNCSSTSFMFKSAPVQQIKQPCVLRNAYSYLSLCNPQKMFHSDRRNIIALLFYPICTSKSEILWKTVVRALDAVFWCRFDMKFVNFRFNIIWQVDNFDIYISI